MHNVLRWRPMWLIQKGERESEKVQPTLKRNMSVTSVHDTTLFLKDFKVEGQRWMRPWLRLVWGRILGVSGLLKGEGSAEQFSLPNESSLCLCANFLFSASAIRAAGSDEHTTPLLLRLLTGVPPGDLSTKRSLTWFRSFSTSNIEGRAAGGSHCASFSLFAAFLCRTTSDTDTSTQLPIAGEGSGGGGGGRQTGVEVRTGTGRGVEPVVAAGAVTIIAICARSLCSSSSRAEIFCRASGWVPCPSTLHPLWAGTDTDNRRSDPSEGISKASLNGTTFLNLVWLSPSSSTSQSTSSKVGMAGLSTVTSVWLCLLNVCRGIWNRCRGWGERGRFVPIIRTMLRYCPQYVLSHTGTNCNTTVFTKMYC